MQMENLNLLTHRLKTPIQESELKKLQIGDIVYLDGCIFTGRIGVYKKVLDEGVSLPFDIRALCNVTFHCSPAVGMGSDGSFKISAVTGTASFRFARWMPGLFKKTGVKVVIGKGGMQQQVYDRVFTKYGAVYLTTVGYGLGATYGKCIKGVVDVFFREELGLAQAMWIIEVDNLGPFLVECDTLGNSLQSLSIKEINKKFGSLYKNLPALTLKRLGEIDSFKEEVV